MIGGGRFWAAFALVLLLAAALRLTGLGFGLRHRPYPDERVFVENAHRMVAERSLDPRYYEYPGLVFGLLAPAIALVGVDRPPGPAAYLAARATVAAFGVLSVALVALLGRRLMGDPGALTAAFFLAVSPVEVDAAHMVKPDIMLEAFVLLAFLAFRRVSERPLGDLLAGAALGAAMAVKFSGVLLAPCYLLQRLVTPGSRGRGIALAGLAAAAIFFLSTPYSLIHAGSFLASGVLVQLRYHYRAEVAPLSYPAAAKAYLETLVEAFGPSAFLALPTCLLRREWRTWAPLLLFPVIVILVFSTSSVHHDRFLVPCLGVVALAAGRTIDAIFRRHRVLALVLAVAAATPGLISSATYAWHLTRPGTQDRIADWTAAHVPEGARILNLAPYLELDRTRFEVLEPSGSSRLDPYLARHVDFVVAGPDQAELARGLSLVHSVDDPKSPELSRSLAVFRVPENSVPRYRRLDLAAARLSASVDGPHLESLRDGRKDTEWSTAGPQAPGAWVQVDLKAPALIGRIELELGPNRNRWGRDLRVLVSDDGTTWRVVPVAQGRGPVDEQPDGGTGPSQVLILAPTCVRGLRVVQEASADRRWAIAELYLEAVASTSPDPPESCADALMAAGDK